MTTDHHKKHPCPDCRQCQVCTASRCSVCRGQDHAGEGGRFSGLSMAEQIRLYEEVNRAFRPDR